jgi:hypothetical protein
VAEVVEQRCVHEMLVDQCSWCTPRAPEPIEAASVRAKYPGRCMECGESIAVGDTISWNDGHEGWVGECCS